MLPKKKESTPMIGERLRDLRIQKGLTQQQLADQLHLAKHNISAYERNFNEPPDAIKIAIALYFDVSVDYLLGLTELPNAYETPNSRRPVHKKLPGAAKELVNCVASLMALAEEANPPYVTHRIDRTAKRILSEQKPDSSKLPPQKDS